MPFHRRGRRDAPTGPAALRPVGSMEAGAGAIRKRAAGDVRPPPPRTFTLSQRQVLLAAAPGAAAAFLLGLHAGSRALATAADAGATRALATASLAATTAITRLTASTLAEGGGHEGHEGQCRQEQQTVHGKNPLHGKLNRSRHVTTCDRGKATADVTRPAGSRPRTGRHRFGGRFSSARRRRGPGLAGSARKARPPHTPGSRRSHAGLPEKPTPPRQPA